MTTPSTNTIVSEITIRAAAARVFAALTEPQQRLRWWTAGGRFKALDSQSDLRPGGAWMMAFDSGGEPASIRGVYRRIDAPHLLEFTWLPSWDPQATETLVRIELDERDGVTTVRLIHSGFANDGARARHKGWPELLESLRGFAEAPV